MDNNTLSTKLTLLTERLKDVESVNPALANVVTRLLDMHTSRLESYIDSALSLLDNAEDLDRDRLVSVLCFIVVAQQQQHNH